MIDWTLTGSEVVNEEGWKEGDSYIFFWRDDLHNMTADWTLIMNERRKWISSYYLTFCEEKVFNNRLETIFVVEGKEAKFLTKLLSYSSDYSPPRMMHNQF